MRSNSTLRTVSLFDAHHRLLIAIAISVVVFLIVRDRLHVSTRIVVTWDVYSIATLLMAWIAIILSNPRELRRTSSLQDSSRTLISVLLLLAAVASIFSVVVLLRPDGRTPTEVTLTQPESLSLHIIISFLAVVSSWTLVHTTFTLRYAHIFYENSRSGAEHVGGLAFPATEEPDYLDFAYFAFVIGMTSQVSDVAITSRRMRRLALLHGIISFGFNTMVLALGVNVTSGLL